MHLAIECVIDISNHAIADMRFRIPDSNMDSFEDLRGNNIIKEKLKNNLCNMASFRNILVHDYIKLDRVVVMIWYYNKQLKRYRWVYENSKWVCLVAIVK